MCPSKSILAFGDSLTSGVCSQGTSPYTRPLQRLLSVVWNSAVEVKNAGRTGECTESMVQQLREEIKSIERERANLPVWSAVTVSHVPMELWFIDRSGA